MSRTIRTLAAAALGGLATLAAPAHAIGPVIVCRQVTVGLQNVATVCAGAGVVVSGTTVAPTVYWGCTIGDRIACTGQPIGAGTTGFVPNPSYPLPTVDPATGSVKVYPGTIGTVWIDGQSAYLVTSGFCVGDPSFC